MKTDKISSYKWYGFDLDGTIADNSLHSFGMGEIGKPIKRTIALMRKLHARGADVRIFTARLSDVGDTEDARRRVTNHIWEWCDRNLGFRPSVVDRKNASMEFLFDDRAKQVVRNKGYLLEDVNEELVSCLRDVMSLSLVRFDERMRKKIESALSKCE